MRYLASIVGYAIAGMFVMNVWGALAGAYGLLGGWFAALVIIFLVWTMNHFANMVYNQDGAAWVDMATGIAVTGTMRDIFDGMDISLSIPTLVLVIIGGAIGGACGGLFKKAVAASAKS
jgi:hypothetical protein